MNDKTAIIALAIGLTLNAIADLAVMSELRESKEKTELRLDKIEERVRINE